MSENDFQMHNSVSLISGNILWCLMIFYYTWEYIPHLGKHSPGA